MFMKRWIAEIESYGFRRRDVVRYDLETEESIVIPWRVSIYRGPSAPRGVGEPYPFKWRVLQFFGIYFFLRRVRKAVRDQHGT